MLGQAGHPPTRPPSRGWRINKCGNERSRATIVFRDCWFSGWLPPSDEDGPPPRPPTERGGEKGGPPPPPNVAAPHQFRIVEVK